MLGLSRAEVAGAAGIAERTLIDFERGARVPHRNNQVSVRRALELAGAEFTSDGGLRLRVLWRDSGEDEFLFHLGARAFRAGADIIRWLEPEWRSGERTYHLRKRHERVLRIAAANVSYDPKYYDGEWWEIRPEHFVEVTATDERRD